MKFIYSSVVLLLLVVLNLNIDIFFPSRISLTLACPMDLRLYPLDKQVCVLQIASCKFKIIINPAQ
jgi:hypothetical protein